MYYPEERLEIIRNSEPDINGWYAVTLYRLVLLTRRVSSKYTREYVRKLIPGNFTYIIKELLAENEEIGDKHVYYREIVPTVIYTGAAEPLIITFCKLIQDLVINHLHNR